MGLFSQCIELNDKGAREKGPSFLFIEDVSGDSRVPQHSKPTKASLVYMERLVAAAMSTCAEAIMTAFRSPCDQRKHHDVYADTCIDFDNVYPTDGEREVYEVCVQVLAQAQRILNDLHAYGHGATDAIRKAIMQPNDAAVQSASWLQVLERVRSLKTYYDFSLRINQIVPLLLWELCSGPLSAVDAFEAHQALTKQFAQILDFALRFDQQKQCTPAIQNDFSYYRRSMSREAMAYGVTTPSKSAVVPMDLANTLSLFYADPCPMLNSLTQATQGFVQQQSVPPENCTDVLGTMAGVCNAMVTNPLLAGRADTRLFLLTVMTAAVILYDHVHQLGAYSRQSSVDVVSVIRTLQSAPAAESEPLLNALRYTSKHLNDDNTIKTIKVLLSL